MGVAASQVVYKCPIVARVIGLACSGFAFRPNACASKGISYTQYNTQAPVGDWSSGPPQNFGNLFQYVSQLTSHKQVSQYVVYNKIPYRRLEAECAREQRYLAYNTIC